MYTFSLMRVIGGLALVSFLLHALVRKWKVYFGAAFFLYSAYWGFGILTIFHTSDFPGTVRACGAILGNLFFFFLVVNAVRSWRLAKAGMLVWLGASALIGVYTAYDWHIGRRSIDESKIGQTEERLSTVWSDASEWESLEQVQRAMGPTSHAAVYGINLILTLPFFAYLLRVETTRLRRAVTLLGALIVLYNILLTNTRAAILLAALVIALCVLRKVLVVKPAGLLAVLLLGSLILPFVPGAVYERVLDISNYTQRRSGTLRIRMDYWSAGLKIAEANWLLGVGIGNQNTVPRYLKGDGPEQTTVHNEYLQTLLEVGIVGWSIFFGFVGLILWCSVKAAAVLQRLRDAQEQYWLMVACQIGMVSVLLYGVQVDVFHFPLKGWWLIAGLSWVMYQRTQQAVARGEPAALEGVRSG
jgi:O-antigen ligase